MVSWSHWKDIRAERWPSENRELHLKISDPEFYGNWDHFTSWTLTLIVPLLSLSRVLKAPVSEQTLSLPDILSYHSDKRESSIQAVAFETYGTWHPASRGSRCSCRNPCSHFHRCICEWSSGTAGHSEESLRSRCRDETTAYYCYAVDEMYTLPACGSGATISQQLACYLMFTGRFLLSKHPQPDWLFPIRNTQIHTADWFYR